MIAIITSAINPYQVSGAKPKSYIDVKTRLDQTIQTIDLLLLHSFSKIFLVDNSKDFDFSILHNKYGNQLITRHFKQYQFPNKGVNELLLIMNILEELPEGEIIFKISGRYYPTKDFVCDLTTGNDFKVRHYNLYSKGGTISTRAYFVLNKEIYKEFLLKCLNEVFIYPQRVVGLRSAIHFLRQLIKPQIPSEFNTSIEFAAARVLKNGAYNLQFVNPIGIEGQIAGFEPIETISE